MDYEKDVQIDLNRLETEWHKQASLFYKYSKMLADSDYELTEQKDHLDFVYAKLDGQYREELAGGKVTEAMIKNNITTNEKYVKAQAKLRDLKYQHNIINAAVKSLEHKKKALENLVQLHLSGYFAQPSDYKTNENMSESISDRQHKNLNKRRESNE